MPVVEGSALGLNEPVSQLYNYVIIYNAYCTHHNHHKANVRMSFLHR